MDFPTHEPHYISVLLKIFYYSLVPLSSDFLIFFFFFPVSYLKKIYWSIVDLKYVSLI